MRTSTLLFVYPRQRPRWWNGHRYHRAREGEFVAVCDERIALDESKRMPARAVVSVQCRKCARA